MTKVDAETSDKVKSVNAAYEKGKEEVLNILVNTVLRVTPQIHVRIHGPTDICSCSDSKILASGVGGVVINQSFNQLLVPP